MKEDTLMKNIRERIAENRGDDIFFSISYDTTSYVMRTSAHFAFHSLSHIHHPRRCTSSLCGFGYCL